MSRSAIPNRLWFIAALACLAIVGAASGTVLTEQPHVDFYSFWNSSRLILGGHAADAYRLQPSDLGQLMPLAYPPAFLLLIWPAALIPFAPSFIAWVVGTGALYFVSARAPKWIAIGNPSAAYNGMVGQNGFVTSAIMLSGLQLLSRNPAVGGAILGLMIVKPQLAVLLPVAVIAGRKWAAIPAAMASATLMLALAAALFGMDAYRGFLEVLPSYQHLLASGRWPWEKLASTFALVRWSGGSETLAWAAHAAVAAAAAGLVWQSWRRDWEAKAPILAAGSLLVSPYLFTYDAVMLVAPLAFLAERRPWWALAVAALSALPLAQVMGLHWGPNTTPLAAMLAMILLVRLEPQ